MTSKLEEIVRICNNCIHLKVCGDPSDRPHLRKKRLDNYMTKIGKSVAVPSECPQLEYKKSEVWSVS